MRARLHNLVLGLAALSCGYAATAFALEPAASSDAPIEKYPAEKSDARPLQRLADRLPAPISDGLELQGWIWLADLQNNAHPQQNYYDAVLSLSMTKSFDQRVAVTVQGTFIDADGNTRADLEQAFLSTLLSRETQTIVSIGKFNADFGIEGRDFWDRRTGTTSLLFNAQPQDMVGIMLTQPIGESGITLRPFVSADFQGQPEFDQAPSAGLVVEFEPSRELKLSVTNWVGPGFVLEGGKPLRHPFPQGDYGYDAGAVVENWQGPNLVAERGSTLYFVNANATWRPRRDLSLSIEYLLGRTGTSDGPWGWHGWMALAEYDITDRTYVWGRYSALDDSDWIITGWFAKFQEVSCGIGHQIHDGIEVRFEYRHDFSNVTEDFDSVSVHLAMAF